MTEDNFTHLLQTSLKAEKMNCLGTILSFPKIQEIYFSHEFFYPDFVHSIFRCITVYKEELVETYSEEKFQEVLDELNRILELLEIVKRYFSSTCTSEDLVKNIPEALEQLSVFDFSAYSFLVEILGYKGKSRLMNRAKKIVRCAENFMIDPAFQEQAIFSHYHFFNEMLHRLAEICPTPSDIIYVMYSKDVIKQNPYAHQCQGSHKMAQQETI